MRRKGILRFMKGFIGALVISLLVLCNSNTARAEAKADDVDMEAIMSALNGRAITDGDIINVTDDIRIEVTVKSTSSSTSVSKDSSLSNITNGNISIAAATGSTTETFTANCQCFFNNVLIATITHKLTVINYTTGLVHISSGSLSASPNNSAWTTSTYGYSIANTDGSYSSAIGTAKLTNASLGKYALYNCTAAVNPGKTPIFTFVQN